MASNSDLIISILFLSHISVSGGLGAINFKVLHFALPELGSLCCICRLCSTRRSVISFLQTGSSFLTESSNAQSAMQAWFVTVSTAATLNARMCRTTSFGACMSLFHFIADLCGFFCTAKFTEHILQHKLL